jgi:hypothetical protein
MSTSITPVQASTVVVAAATPVLPSIIDAFTLNPAIRYRPGYYMASALGSMDVLRRANTYRPKWYIVPDDEHVTIGAYQTHQVQIHLVTRSYVWGLIVNQFSTVAPYAQINADDVWCQITDSGSGIPFFSDFVRGRGFQSLQATVNDQRNAMLPYLFTQPRLILEPGLLAVELANTAAVAIRPQFILFVAEPWEEYRR